MRFSRSCNHSLLHASVTTTNNYTTMAYISAAIKFFRPEGNYADQGPYIIRIYAQHWA
jgi:hypothetical protein